MKLLGFLIMTAALVLGVAIAPTAYLPRLDLPDEQLIGLTLNAPAGKTTPEEPPEDPAAPGEPIAAPDTELTPELLAELRAANVDRVRVKEFSFARWSGRWWFLLAAAGLLVGAALVRVDTRKRLAASREDATADESSPEGALAAIIDTIEGLRRDLPHMTTEQDREAAIIERFGETQSVHVPAFVDGRERLVSKHGLSGYAAIMDRFAAMERQINRAWSAAADAVDDEAIDCIERASALAQETLAAMDRG
ncbi:MAG: hypothetical protein NCW75_04640 [Phycisphaera sp.]|nr:MAG: hypothetical protein NCW75_04640 [Phycisphaera sp.]